MPRKVLIVGAAVVAAVIVLVLLRRRANAATMATGGATLNPQAAIAALTATPPQQLAGAVLEYAGSQAGAAVANYAGTPQGTPKPVTQIVQDLARLPFVGTNFREAAGHAQAIESANYRPSVGYYG